MAHGRSGKANLGAESIFAFSRLSSHGPLPLGSLGNTQVSASKIDLIHYRSLTKSLGVRSVYTKYLRNSKIEISICLFNEKRQLGATKKACNVVRSIHIIR